MRKTTAGQGNAAQRGGAGPKADEPTELVVSGCANATISDIVKGNYRRISTNHGKPVHKKDGKAKGLDVLVYYWDDRDGSDLCGWWFGPTVGGDQVWAFHPSRTSALPPHSEWNVPHDGPIDHTFTITYKSAEASGRSSPERRPAKEAGESGGDNEDADRKRAAQDDEARPAKRRARSPSGSEERARREEEEKRRGEEKKQREEEELRRKEEQKKQEEVRKQGELKKLQEGLRRRRQEEEERNGLGEAAQLREKQAVITVIHVLIRFANATPEDYKHLRVMYDGAVEKYLPLAVKQQASLKAECERVLSRTTAYVEALKEQQQKWGEFQQARQRKALAGETS